MIPRLLHLYNFLSYGDSCEPIGLDGVHVACLCGPNGHGKSALLDAITWALWGQARTSQADELIRRGQKSMFVELDFDLDGQQYRVVRKRTAGKTSQSDLQFQTREPDGQWRPLTGQGVRGTQERINTALRMDYETFINSAFLLQGRADEFARKTPGDRKRILGEILGLSIYDRLVEKARARRLDAQMRGANLDADLQRLQQDHARLQELEQRAASLAAEHAAAQLAAAEARARLSEVMVDRARLEARRKERDDLTRRLEAAEGELRTLRSQLGAVEARVAASERLTARAAEIRAVAQEYSAVVQERDTLTARLQAATRLQERRALLRTRVQEERGRLETQVQLRRQTARELGARAEQLPQARADEADLERQVQVVPRLEEELAALQTRLQELAAEGASAAAEQRRCADALEQYAERFQLLKGARAACPTCEADLPEDKRLDLGRRLKKEQADLKEAQGRAIQAEADCRRADTETKARVRAVEGKLKTLLTMRDRLAHARQTTLTLEAAAEALPRELEVLAELEGRLRDEDYAREEAAELRALEAELAGLGEDSRRLDRAQARARELAGAERLLDELLRAEADLPPARTQRAELESAIRAREEALAEDRAARAEADREVLRLPAVEAETRKLEAALQTAEGTERRALQEMGAARQAVETCRGLLPQIEARRLERATVARDQAAYEELAKAFGRNGIQALIIENAIPEIEEEANTLLSRMTDNQMHVRLKSQRDLKSGGQAETLEIEISDGMGARRYELYSGGEAFRVNFALRIALSKLLAKRAGAPLETLFIDEGFGSQDEDGRRRLVEAIQAVQEDFGRILVITHIDELKDQFPTRIEVTKDGSGSRVAVY